MLFIIWFLLQYVDFLIEPRKADSSKEYDNRAYCRRIDKHNRRMAFSTIFKHRCSIEQNRCFIEESSFWRWFYAAKAFICLLLGRKAKRLDDEVAVCLWDVGIYSTLEETGERWQELSVGYGIFREWKYTIEENGYP